MHSRARKPILASIALMTAIVGSLVVAPAAYAASTGWISKGCANLQGVTAYSTTASSYYVSHLYSGTKNDGSGYSWVKDWQTGGTRQSYSSMRSGQYGVYTEATSITSYAAGCYYL